MFKIFGSSAGSGKTFTLTKSYLKLVLQSISPQAYRQILAITFTNDAAAEMKSRVLSALQEMGEITPKMSGRTEALQSMLLAELKIEKVEMAKRAKSAFYDILENYSDFHIKTIDSFFNQLTTAFSRDLNLPYGYEVVLDKRPLLLQATERVLDKIGTEGHEQLSHLVQKFAEEQADDGKNWQNIVPNLAKFADDTFNDQFYALIRKNDPLQAEDYLQIKKQVDRQLAIIRNAFLKIGQKAQNVFDTHGLQVDDFAFGKSGVANFYIQIQDELCEQLNKDWAPGKRLTDAIEHDKWYAKGQNEGIKAKIDGAKEELIHIYEEVLVFLEKEKPTYILLKEIRKSLDNLALLDQVNKAFYALLQEKNQAYLTDFNRRIQAVISAEPVPYLFERLGEKFDHILIDEFQDTSDLQFYNLLPLIENALAKDSFNMLVGDPKQSIYRWRGGKVELMIHLMNKNASALIQNPLLSLHQKEAIQFTNRYVDVENLAHNYRSTKEIVDFNNAFFKKVYEEHKNQPLIASVFEQVEQMTHDGSPTGGHVEFLLQNDKECDEQVWTLTHILESIEKLKAEGYGYEDLAILCRTKAPAAYIANRLVECGYPVISADSLLLKNNLGVLFLVSMLKTFYDPQATVEAIMLYHRYKKKEFPSQVSDNLWTFLQQEGFAIDLSVLQAFGLYQLTETLAAKLGLFEDRSGLPYLFAFLDFVQSQVKANGNDLSQFLQLWEQQGKNLAVNPQEQKAITVSTIHKAKGLEYPVVLVPFANWSLKPIPNSSAWFDLENAGIEALKLEEKALLASPLGLKKSLENTAVSRQYETEMELARLEALNVLYVAFTRPVERLYVLAKAPSRNTEESVFKLLDGFTPYEVQENGEAKITIVEGSKPMPRKKEELTNEWTLEHIESVERVGKLRVKSSTDLLFDEQNKRNRGNLVHALLSEIKKEDDLDEALRKLQFKGLIQEKERQELKDEALKVLNNEALSPYFSGDIRVENERDILVKDQEAARPDRVVITDDKVVILDYKTGKKQKSHERQLQQYGELYRQMGYEKVELLLVYLNPLEIVPIR
ncbi:UvrD-helicase domain-containing protein [Marinilongibacter aquaticus]|uniref:UvrD-helicase domain-containing protein n=1 Tax=Marinilongibacter aquaticus TaxID=2975157 RepID=UPI0021BD0180|nr:UvrD-helicase domain-containing protein [Marinilongibacter aquaticus]UBM60295.1 UvrD-helicase domain-containing protein [Marinilongibacter aquaticus]